MYSAGRLSRLFELSGAHLRRLGRTRARRRVSSWQQPRHASVSSSRRHDFLWHLVVAGCTWVRSPASRHRGGKAELKWDLPKPPQDQNSSDVRVRRSFHHACHACPLMSILAAESKASSWQANHPGQPKRHPKTFGEERMRPKRNSSTPHFMYLQVHLYGVGICMLLL